jgi:DNA repair protein RadA/Sms
VGCSLATMDVFVSVVGGVKVSEPALDLALGLALVSAASGVPLGADLVACGEVGLGGELRQVVHTERRLAEAARLGFSRACVPESAPEPPGSMTLVRATTLAQAVASLGLLGASAGR